MAADTPFQIRFSISGDDETATLPMKAVSATLNDLQVILNGIGSEMGLSEPVHWNFDSDTIEIGAYVNGASSEQLDAIVSKAYEGFLENAERSDRPDEARDKRFHNVIDRLRRIADVEIEATGHERLHIEFQADEKSVRRQSRSLSEFSEVDGRLDIINVHGRPEFVLYEHITGHRIPCTLDDEAFKTVKAHLGERVVVEGLVSYRRNGIARKVTSVSTITRVNPPKDEISDLKGKIPDFTGDIKDSGEFVRRIREDEDE